MTKFWFAMSAAMFFFGMAIGFYVTVYFSKQLAALGAAGVIIAIFGGAGTATTGMNLLVQWSREPTLRFGTTSPNDEHVYHLAVTKTRGKGMAENCAAFLTVNDTNVTDSATIWSLYGNRVVNIGDVDVHARLFKVVDDNTVLFPVANEVRGLDIENPYPLNQVLDKVLTVKMTSTNGNTPKPFRETIRNIISVPE
jgi:hypothetical protein